VGTQIAEVQDLVGAYNWRYIPYKENPADNMIRRKSLAHLVEPNRWTCGPTFLHQSPAEWPTNPAVGSTSTPAEETRDTLFCGNITVNSFPVPDATQVKSWS